MDPNGDFEIDPAIAAAMGFGNFGTQNKPKRKFDPNDGFVDPNVNAATGANNTILPAREAKSAKTASHVDNDQEGSEKRTGELYDPKTQESPNLELLRQGVKNVRGDLVYFLPSFLEDPWSGLKAQ